MLLMQGPHRKAKEKAYAPSAKKGMADARGLCQDCCMTITLLEMPCPGHLMCQNVQWTLYHCAAFAPLWLIVWYMKTSIVVDLTVDQPSTIGAHREQRYPNAPYS